MPPPLPEAEATKALVASAAAAALLSAAASTLHPSSKAAGSIFQVSAKSRAMKRVVGCSMLSFFASKRWPDERGVERRMKGGIKKFKKKVSSRTSFRFFSKARF